jgi:uncharacterized membrane protein required for colicin V production
MQFANKGRNAVEPALWRPLSTNTANIMKSQDLGIGWVDLLIVTLIIVGVVRGRKHGLSEELLDMVKWMLIVVAAAFAYEPVGGFISSSTMFSQLSSYVFIYAAVILGVIVLFSLLRRGFGGKLIGSDIFGGAEYYLGMCAGGIRYACIILVCMAMLNARYYRPDEIKAHIKYQQDTYGSVYWPSVCALQNEVFGESLTGRTIKNYLSILLIRPTTPEEKSLGSAGIVKARERNIYDILEK